jgi:ATP-dependent Clp protease ATP-binding subunit ClpA
VFERFAGEAKRVIVIAEREAIALGHDYIGTEHLLLGLLGVAGNPARRALADLGVTPSVVREFVRATGHVSPGELPPEDALAAIGIDLEQIRQKMTEAFGPDRFKFPRPPFTRRAKRVLELSVRAAGDQVRPEHLLLGILDEREGVAFKILTDRHADPAELRETLTS